MSFTTPCFIRKNTPEICEKLEETGYTSSFLNKMFERHDIKCNSIIASNISLGLPSYTMSNIKDGNERCLLEGNVEIDCPIHVDCGTDTDLFLAIAAMRSDNDIHQWFTDGNTWVFCTCQGFGMYWSTHECTISLDTVHKAPVSELITYFKNKEQ